MLSRAILRKVLLVLGLIVILSVVLLVVNTRVFVLTDLSQRVGNSYAKLFGRTVDPLQLANTDTLYDEKGKDSWRYNYLDGALVTASLDGTVKSTLWNGIVIVGKSGDESFVSRGLIETILVDDGDASQPPAQRIRPATIESIVVNDRVTFTKSFLKNVRNLLIVRREQ